MELVLVISSFALNPGSDNFVLFFDFIFFCGREVVTLIRHLIRPPLTYHFVYRALLLITGWCFRRCPRQCPRRTQAVPEVVPEVVPEAVPEAVPEEVPEAVPEERCPSSFHD